MADIAGMRHPYHGICSVFDINDLAARDPFKQFTAWFEDACKIDHLQEPNAMALATATKDGVPSVRMVLLKGYDVKGFRFFTNYCSRKAKEIEENPRCSIMFYWEPVKRSVRIEGEVEKLTTFESAEYFQSRPKESKIGALVSHQSSVVADRMVLTNKYNELLKTYEGDCHIPKPDYWGGYRVIPKSFEFWQGQTNRLHDRLVFRHLKTGETFDETLMERGDNGWVIQRLSS